jgi:small multidrug resistance family-3 protein
MLRRGSEAPRTEANVTADLVRAGGLFVVTAVAEIVGCYLPYLWLRHGRSGWWLLPGAASLALFVWLLSLHPGPAGRTYAAYGAVYVATAVLWLAIVEGQRPDRWDVVGVVVSLLGMAIILIHVVVGSMTCSKPSRIATVSRAGEAWIAWRTPSSTCFACSAAWRQPG